MNLLSELPVWGQWSVLGILVSIIVFVIILLLKGDLVTRKHVDSVQKTADSWQKAWETSMQVQASMTLVLEKMMTVAETMEHLLVSLPQPDKKQGDDS